MDLLEAGTGVFTDVVVLQTVSAEARHRNLSLYSRLGALMRAAGRRFVPFANEHHRETFVARREGERPNDYNDRAVRSAAAWFAEHLRPLGLRVLLLTDDVANARLATAEGVHAASSREFVDAQTAHPGLKEVLASISVQLPADGDVAGRGRGSGGGTTATTAAE